MTLPEYQAYMQRLPQQRKSYAALLGLQILVDTITINATRSPHELQTSQSAATWMKK
jgi:hypothetical protein